MNPENPQERPDAKVFIVISPGADVQWQRLIRFQIERKMTRRRKKIIQSRKRRRFSDDDAANKISSAGADAKRLSK